MRKELGEPNRSMTCHDVSLKPSLIFKLLATGRANVSIPHYMKFSCVPLEILGRFETR